MIVTAIGVVTPVNVRLYVNTVVRHFVQPMIIVNTFLYIQINVLMSALLVEKVFDVSMV
jgi:hypothetical protein